MRTWHDKEIQSHNQYEELSEVLYTFTRSKLYGYLLNVEPSNLVFLKTYNSEFHDIAVILNDQNSRPLEMEENINSIVITHSAKLRPEDVRKTPRKKRPNVIRKSPYGPICNAMRRICSRTSLGRTQNVNLTIIHKMTF